MKSAVPELLKMDIQAGSIQYYPRKTRVFYIDVTNMPRSKAIDYVKEMRQELAPDCTQYENFFLGVRDDKGNRIEVLG